MNSYLMFNSLKYYGTKSHAIDILTEETSLTPATQDKKKSRFIKTLRKNGSVMYQCKEIIFPKFFFDIKPLCIF